DVRGAICQGGVLVLVVEVRERLEGLQRAPIGLASSDLLLVLLVGSGEVMIDADRFVRQIRILVYPILTQRHSPVVDGATCRRYAVVAVDGLDTVATHDGLRHG